MPDETAPARTYEVRTYGCQMNVHDSERMAGLLEDAGYVAAADGEPADVVVFNTCAVRENADNKLYGNLGHLAPGQGRQPGHADRRRRLPGAEGPRRRSSRRRPGSTSSSAPTTSARCRCCWSGRGHNDEAQVEILESLEVFPSTLPTKRESAYAGWVSISVGCNNTCTFCIVPALRGKEKDRRPGDILAEIQALVDDGVIEVTLLGQNVNSYGVEFGDRQAFSKLLRACGEIDGLERVRFTSPAPGRLHRRRHRRDGRDPQRDAAAAHAAAVRLGQGAAGRCAGPTVQRSSSGSSSKVRAAIPHAAITTDIIVGFPGETEEDFQATLDVVRAGPLRRRLHLPVLQAARHPGRGRCRTSCPRTWSRNATSASPPCRTGSPAEENARQLGRRVEVMVTARPGRKDGETHRLSGRAPDNRLVHFSVPDGAEAPRPGDLVTVTITEAAAFHLVADPATADDYSLRRSRAGDAWDRSQADSCGAPAPAADRRHIRRFAGHAEPAGPRPLARGRLRSTRQAPTLPAPPTVPPRRETPALRIRPAGHRRRRAHRIRKVAIWPSRWHLALDGEVVNADAMQFYRGMDIGTAKITEAERRGVPHHLLDILDVTEEASVSDFQQQARAVIADIHARGKRAILAGGSGLYVRAALDVLEFPGTDPAIRRRLEAEEEAAGLAPLRARLELVDPVSAGRLGDARRVIRALEVFELTGRPFSSFMPTREYFQPAVQIGLDVDRDQLRERLAARVHTMVDAGAAGGGAAPRRRRAAPRQDRLAGPGLRAVPQGRRRRVGPGAGRGRDHRRDPAVRPPPAHLVPRRPADQLAGLAGPRAAGEGRGALPLSPCAAVSVPARPER